MNYLKLLFISITLSTSLFSDPVAVNTGTVTSVNDSTTASSSSGSTENTINGLSRSEVGKKLTAPIENLMGSVQWSLFKKEFEMTLDWGFCCKEGDLLSCAIGFATKMIEPIGFMESVQKPLYFPFADIDLGGNPIKGGSLMTQTENSVAMRSSVADAHFIYLPIFGMIFKKTMAFVCFHKGDLDIPYLSEFDPTWKQDVYYSKMIPQMISSFSVNGLLSTVFDCLAVSIANSINGYFGGDAGADVFQGDYESFDSVDTNGQPENANKMNDTARSTIDSMNTIMDTMYFVAGCSGFSPVGGYVNGEDVIQDSSLSFHGMQGMLHGLSAVAVPYLYKQTQAKFNMSQIQKRNENANPTDTMCTWKTFPLPIPSQYVLQLSYPVVGEGKESGVTGAEVSTAKNVPGSQNAIAYNVWVRRDYYAFAYFCGND